MADPVRWWDIRPAQSTRPKTYTCPICHGFLPAMMPNTLLSPEGDRERRRHAHTACVARQRQAGKLPTKAEWERVDRPPKAKRSWLARLFGSRTTEDGRKG